MLFLQTGNKQRVAYVCRISPDERLIRSVCVSTDSRAEVSTSNAALVFMRTEDDLAET